MRIAVTGRNGQVATALRERGARAGVYVLPLVRPELNLEHPATIAPAIKTAGADIIVSAAAYTRVDAAESEPQLAHTINTIAPGAIGAAAKTCGIPIIHMSTDYVFAGDKPSPYVETDETKPRTVYGQSKLAGERALAANTDDHVILRTAWVYSPFGANFVKTMLRLGESHDSIRVVADQYGNPTLALDIADAILAIARAMLSRPGDPALRGTFHLVGQGEASWAEFAAAIFEAAAAQGRRHASVVPIATADYPTAAVRPLNSRLSTEKLKAIYGIVLPPWRKSVHETLQRLV